MRERSATDSPDDGAEESPDSLSALLPYWFLLAALAQLLFLFGWPMFVYGRWAPYPAVAAVALTRLGLYTALGAGLLRRDRIAWAGGLVEILRSVLLFLVAVWGHDGSLTDALFPAWWVQGLFSAVLPVHFGLLVAMEWGWRPGGTLEGYTMIAARILVAAAVVSAMSLRRSGAAMGIPRKRQLRAVLVSGLPFGVLITAVELAVWLAAGAR